VDASTTQGTLLTTLVEVSKTVVHQALGFERFKGFFSSAVPLSDDVFQYRPRVAAVHRCPVYKASSRCPASWAAPPPGTTRNPGSHPACRP